MLSTTCWAIMCGSEQVEERIYLHKEDAENALAVVGSNERWRTSHTPLTLASRVMVLAFGVSDQRVPSESVLPRMGTLPLPLFPGVATV